MRTYKEALRDWQREYFTSAIAKCEGSMIKAAQLIGVNRSAFYDMCKRAGIKRTDQRRGRKITVNKGNKAWQELGRQEQVS